jgi:hypothetical protein
MPFPDNNPSLMEFINTDLDVALTFTEIAQNSRNQETVTRNRANARRAYVTVLRYSQRLSATAEASEQINTKLEQVKSALQKLGETL